MEFFAVDEVVAQMEADLASAKDGARLELLLELSWQLRQRDTKRAEILADEIQSLLACAELSAHERQKITLRLLLIRGEAKCFFGDVDTSTTLAENALQGFRELNDAQGCVDALWVQAWIASDQGYNSRIEAICEEMLTLGLGNHSVPIIAAQTILARYAALRDIHAAKAHWGEYFTALTENHPSRLELHPAAMCWIEDFWGFIATLSSDYVQAILHYSQAYTLALASGQYRMAMFTASHTGDKFSKLNEYPTALEWMQRGLVLARQSGWPGMTGAALTHTAEILRCLQRFNPASDMLREGLAMMAAMPSSRSYAIALQYLGEVELDRKQCISALDTFRLLEQRASALNQTDLLSNALRGQAHALSRLAQPQAAMQAAIGALAAAKSNTLNQIAALRVMADIHARHPLPVPPDMTAASAPLHYLQQALKLAAAITDYIIPGDLLEMVADEYAKVGDTQRAYELSKQAIQAHEKIHSREADNRANAMQINYQTEQARSEAEHHRQLAGEEARRAGVLQQNSDTLERLGAIGQEITAHLETRLVCAAINRHVHHLLEVNIFGIALMDQDGMGLHSIFNDIDGELRPSIHFTLADPDYYLTRCVRERREFLIDQDPELEEVRTHQWPTLSRLISPMCVADKVLGVMTIQSSKRYAYGAREQMIFRTLCAYAAIAISNSLAHNDLATTYSELASTHQYLKETQAKLVQSEKMAAMGSLVAGIAHEINTPLGTSLMAISGAENALQELKAAIDGNRLSKSMLDASTTEALEYTNLALRTGSRAADLVTLFKTIAVQGEDDHCIDVDFTEYLTEVTSLVREPLNLRGCRLELDVPAGLRLTIVPEALFKSLACVFANVLDHAFSDGKTGLLRLCALAESNNIDSSDEVIIEIQDNGHGIAEEHLPKVFDPFFSTKSGLLGHVGLGLHVAFNHITQRLKGEIRIASTLGTGTTVTIRLKTKALISNTA